MFGKKNLLREYTDTVRRNYGKRPTPLLPHIQKRLESLRTKSNAKRAQQKASKRITQGRVYNEGTGGQYSSFTGPTNQSYLPKHVEDALPPLVIQNNNTSQLKSGVGKQAVITAMNLFTSGTALTYTSDKITRVVYDTARGDVTMNNIYLSNAYVIIYDIMARKDISNSAIGDPGTAWAQGATDESAGSAQTYLGSNPWSVEVFNQFFKVCQVTSFVLGAGATHVHKVKLQPRKVVSSAFAQYTQYAIKDVTYWTLIEVHGAPANDTVTQTSVSVGVGGLNIVQDKEEVLKQLQKATPTLIANNNLSTSITEQVINIGGSTITTQSEG